MEIVYDPKGGVDGSILASKSYLYFQYNMYRKMALDHMGSFTCHKKDVGSLNQGGDGSSDPTSEDLIMMKLWGLESGFQGVPSYIIRCLYDKHSSMEYQKGDWVNNVLSD